jgi:signal peptidase II
VGSVDSEAAVASRPRLRKGWWVGTVAALVLLADQLTKSWALSRLSGFRTFHVISTLDFQLAFNQGMAFSRGQGLGKLIAVAAAVIIVVLAWFARSIDNRSQLFCLGIVMGGAAGNLADRVFRAGTGFLGGRVVDFINLHWWPVFNVSDSAIVVGGIALALLLSLQAPAAEDDSSADPDADTGAAVATAAGAPLGESLSDESG